MSNRVFLVDDEISKYRAWLAEMELAGLVVETMWGADAAFERLWDIDREEVALVLIDVMLAVEDLGNTRFTEERTRSYLETGLRLLDDLVKQNPAVFPLRAVMISSSTVHATVANVRATCRRYAIPFWDKARIVSPLDLLDRIDDRLRELGDEGDDAREDA